MEPPSDIKDLTGFEKDGFGLLWIESFERGSCERSDRKDSGLGSFHVGTGV